MTAPRPTPQVAEHGADDAASEPDAARSAAWPGQIRKPVCLAVDYGGTLTDPLTPLDPRLAMRPVCPRAAKTLRQLHAMDIRLLLTSNTKTGQRRGPALEAAGVLHLFAEVLESDLLGCAKPEPSFYAKVTAAARCPREVIMSVGNNLLKDVLGPLDFGMRAALIGQGALSAEDKTLLPSGVVVLSHLSDLPALLRDRPPRKETGR
ncbi:HAD family hydrolase [Streptosporangium sp. CA-115845]|uniref:HAD family hydrolase n=1 Tax=Streptosporangium sp. CA-115845 TaxID=3240071 RepID=UPI003D8B2FA6